MALKFKDLDGRVEALADNVKWLQYGLFFLLAALLFTLGGLVNTYLAEKQATYLDLRDHILEQRVKLDEVLLKLELQDKDLRSAPNTSN